MTTYEQRRCCAWRRATDVAQDHVGRSVLAIQSCLLWLW